METVTEEAKLLAEALSTVKIQVQQMKRHLVCLPITTLTLPPHPGRAMIIADYFVGARPADGCP
jgi:hypothetical protein